MTETTEQTVASRSKLMEAREAERLLPRRLMIGEEALLTPEAAAVYFPREPLEQPIPRITGFKEDPVSREMIPKFSGEIDPYALRIDRLRGRIYNVFAEAVKEAAGQQLAQDTTFDEKATPPELQDFYLDVNGAGTDLHAFGLARAQTAAAEGIDYVLVDYPANPTPGQERTQSEEARLGLRPSWKVYSPGSVLEIVTEMFRGNLRVKRARLMEDVEVPAGPWGSKCVQQVRVLYPGDGLKGSATQFARFEVWRKPVNEKGEEGKWEDAVLREDLSGSMRPQIDVPLVPFNTSVSQDLGEFDSPPPMKGLAWKVIGHARKRSTLDNSQHHVGYPFLFASNVSEESMKRQLSRGLGSSRVFVGGENSDMKHVEPAGTAWESVERSIEKLEDEMHVLAKQPRSERADGPVTARGEIIGEARATVQVKAWARFAETALNTLAYYTWLYLVPNADPEADTGWGSIKLNSQIVPDPNGQTATAQILVDLNAVGKLSNQSLWKALKRLGVPVEGEWEDELKILASQGPIPGVTPEAEDLTGADEEKGEDEAKVA